MLQGLLVINPTPETALPELCPGAYVAILTSMPLRLRHIGLEIRDTLLVLGPGNTRVCFLLRKPLAGATLAQVALEYGTGGIALNACRIRWQGEADREAGKPGSMPAAHDKIFRTHDRSHLDPTDQQNPIGRWPTNLAFVHSPDCRITGTVECPAPTINRYVGLRYCVEGSGGYTASGGGVEEVPLWSCVPACPVAELGAQSRYYPQFAYYLDLFDWLERLITPPGVLPNDI